MRFFKEGSAPDPLYETFRDDQFSWHGESAREFVERAWARCARYCDRDLAEQARQHFLARFWELYLAFSLTEHRVDLEENSRTEGPDLRLKHDPVWIEAVTASAGIGEDAVRRPVPGSVYSVPDAQIKLRLSSAIAAKAAKFIGYRSAGVVGQSDMLVIAVNASDVPNARTDMPLPRIVRVLFPFGNPVAHLNGESFEVVRTSYSFEGAIEKRSGSRVDTAMFSDSAYSHVSAVLYSDADPINRPALPGTEFVLVHNPLATSPLPKRLLPAGLEYWKDGDVLEVSAKEQNRGS